MIKELMHDPIFLVQIVNYTFYKELLKSSAGRNCSCKSKITIMEQLEYIDSKLDWL